MITLTKQEMNDLCKQYGIEPVRIGKYPYPAWYNAEAYQRKVHEGYWFFDKTDTAIIFIPETYSMQKQTFAFLHELGHVVTSPLMKSKIHNEILAWQWAEDFLKKRGIHPNDDFYFDMITSLNTYVPDNYEGY